MGKKLSEMTLEELWQLFPIQLTEHNEIWVDYYNEMKSILENIFAGNHIVRISHIGSTAINGIWAKPIIDILVETGQNEDINKMAIRLEQNGFIRMCTEQNRITLNQGYTKAGFTDKVYHIYLRHFGDNNELYFRDYLNEFHRIAESYEQLKINLWKRYEHNRDDYTVAKTEFITRYTKEAKKYKEKYC